MRHWLVLGAALLLASPTTAQPTQSGTQAHGPFDTTAGGDAGASAKPTSVAASAGAYTSYSQIVPATATTIWPAAITPTRVRAVAIDTAIQSGSTSAVTVWCAWGTAAANPAVVGSNGFPLNVGFDDSGFGTNQSALNCIQPSGAHYVRLETY